MIKLIKKVFWLFKAVTANLIYGFPSKKLTVIGVTGTDGKTTTTTLIYDLLKSQGKKVIYISTVGAVLGNKNYDLGFHVTTPRFFQLQKILREAVNMKIKYVVLEVTSHALYQMRTWGIHFKIGVLTNITDEHLDYHKNYMDYARVKINLINSTDISVINKEPETYYRYRSLIKNKNLWTVGVQKKADLKFDHLKKLGISNRFVCFEKEDILLAFMVGKLLSLTEPKMIETINSFKRIKGRFDYFQRDNKSILIDFAHTPYAFKKLFSAIKENIKPSRIIHVFGCAGLRDRYKRSKMGQISARYANTIIVTEEDYRTENIDDIFAEINKGIKKVNKHIKDKNLFFIKDRQEAVNFAFKIATKKDLILLTGKAHEKSLARGKKEFDWDEYKAVENAIKNLVPA
jgi:UDP-N-acetylmuramoyl-L-alanyl-D-glutamate--2,6-diaminopimelate ligase